MIGTLTDWSRPDIPPRERHPALQIAEGKQVKEEEKEIPATAADGYQVLVWP